MNVFAKGGGLAAIAALSLAGCVQQGGGAYAPGSWNTGQAATGDDALTMAELVQLEVYLKQLGFLAEPVDGEIGASTRAAIGAYQQASGHRPTGSYTHELLANLEQSANTRMGDSGAAARPSVAARTTRPAAPVETTARPSTTTTSASTSATNLATVTAQSMPKGSLVTSSSGRPVEAAGSDGASGDGFRPPMGGGGGGSW